MTCLTPSTENKIYQPVFNLQEMLKTFSSVIMYLFIFNIKTHFLNGNGNESFHVFFNLLITGHIRNLIINGEDVLRNFGYLCVGRV